MHHMKYLSLHGALSTVLWIVLSLRRMLPSKALMLQMFFFVLHIHMLRLKAHIHNINFIF
jgi:predicted metal-binding membrane protein